VNAVLEALGSRFPVRPAARWSELRGRLLGDVRAGPLLPVQALHSAGETMFAVSLAGSLFLNVTVDAARPRILLFLAVTMAPFAVLGPLIGPFIDRVGGGHRTMLMLALGGRAMAALVLATQLRSLLFYPVAFAMIVAAKVYAVSRNALVPVMVEEREHLVVVNSRLARTASIAGAAAAPVAVGVLSWGGAGSVLRVGAVLYALGSLFTFRLPGLRPAPATDAARAVESTEMSGPGIGSATVVMAAMRAATGFTLFHVGFVLKKAGDPAWVFGALAAASAAGTFLGTFVAPRLRRRWREQAMLSATLVLPVALGAVTTLRFHPVTVALLALGLGLSASVARRAFDGVVQAEAPHAKRGQAFAGLETRLELAWVLGALLAVGLRAPGWVGLAVLTAGFAVVAVDRLVRYRQRHLLDAVPAEASLALRLLETAQALDARGDIQQALVVALAALDAAHRRGVPVGEGAEEARRLADAALAGDDAGQLRHALGRVSTVVADVVTRMEPDRAGAGWADLATSPGSRARPGWLRPGPW
jgi:MFS family permease